MNVLFWRDVNHCIYYAVHHDCLIWSVGVGAAGDSPKVIHHLCGAASLILVIPHILSSNVSNSFKLSNVGVVTQV